MGGACSTFREEERCIKGFDKKGKRPIGRPRRRWENNIKMDHRACSVGVWTASIWLRIGTGGRHLGMRYRTGEVHKMWGVA